MAKIVIGVCGGIAAYKALDLINALRRGGHEVQSVMTPSARDFVTELSLATLSGAPVVTSLDERDGTVTHVELGRWADLMVVCPLTATTLARLVSGDASTALSAALLAYPRGKPLVLAPAMNDQMWAHPATVRNMALLYDFDLNLHVVGPRNGRLACGGRGVGALARVEDIEAAITQSLWLGAS